MKVCSDFPTFSILTFTLPRMCTKSDAHRAKAIKHCMQCGRICCMDCAPAADKLPDLSRELWATRRTNDRRIVLPELGTLEPQRLCLLCHAHRDNRLW